MTAAQEQSAAPTPSANTVDCPIAAPTSATPEIKLKWSRAAERPVYEEPVTYFADKMPGQFKEWAQKQHNGDVIITVVIAEDAMRGPRDKDGNRTGGLLASGKGLSRDTIRAWVAALPDEWRAHQGEPPSRTK